MNGKTETRKYFAEDEIDLMDYVEIIIKRKTTVLITVFFFVIIMFNHVYWESRNYEISAIVRMGSFSCPIMTKTDAFYEIRRKEKSAMVEKALGLNLNPNDFNNIVSAENIADSDLIRIKVKHKDPELAKKICDLISDSFVLEKNEILGKRIALLEEQIRKLELNRFVADRERIFQLKQELDGVKKFEVIQSAMISKPPVFWVLLFKFVSAIILGLTIGIFLAFVREFFEKYKHGRD